MSHMVKRMAYASEGGTPWHGLGAVLSDPSNLDLCRIEAGLAFAGHDPGFPIIDCADIHVEAIYARSVGG